MNRRIAALKMELDKARTLYSEVEAMLENGIYNAIIHTLYCSCFRATKALLLTKDLVTKTHKGVESLLQQHFVQTGLFEKDKAVIFKNLMNKRAESDYGDILIEDEEEIKPVIKSAKDYFQYVTKMVEEYLAQEQ